jgi:hypothetical protein
MRCVEQAETWGPAYKEKPCRDALCLPLSKGTSACGSLPSQVTQARVPPGLVCQASNDERGDQVHWDNAPHGGQPVSALLSSPRPAPPRKLAQNQAALYIPGRPEAGIDRTITDVAIATHPLFANHTVTHMQVVIQVLRATMARLERGLSVKKEVLA